MPTFIVVKPTTDVNKAFERGWEDGVHNAINACFPQYKRSWPSFDTPEEADAYNLGRRNGFNSI